MYLELLKMNRKRSPSDFAVIAKKNWSDSHQHLRYQLLELPKKLSVFHWNISPTLPVCHIFYSVNWIMYGLWLIGVPLMCRCSKHKSLILARFPTPQLWLILPFCALYSTKNQSKIVRILIPNHFLHCYISVFHTDCSNKLIKLTL